jgi:O-antigen/teichoic acid export membrane protein
VSESRTPSLRSLARSVPAVVRRDYVTSTVAHWLSLASGLLLFHLVARRDGVAGFTYYQVARGAVATLQPVALLGLVPALHRYLPRAGGRVRVLARQSFLVQVVLMDLIALLGLVLAHDVGRLLGIAGGVPAVRAVILLAAGNCLCVITVAALRGCGQVHLANLVWLLGLGLLPLATFALTPRIEVFLALQGIAMIVLAFGGMAVAGPRRAERTRPVTDPPRLRTLLRYGIRRVPGDIALPALFAFPTFFVATVTRGGPETSYVGFATSAITLICALFGMLTPVLLPRLSGHLQDAAPAATLGRGLRVLPIAAAVLAALVAGAFAAVATPVVHGFLGPEFDDAAGVLRLALPAAIPLAAFYAARPALDALQETPVITRLLLGCLALEILVTHGLGRLTSAGNAAVLGLGAAAGALGVLTYLALRHAVPAR